MRIATLFFLCFFAFPSTQGFSQFYHKTSYLGPSLILATNPMGFAGQFEHAITPEIGIGAVLRYWSQSRTAYSWSLVMPMAQVAYHFKTEVPELDPFAGVRLGFASYSFDTDYGQSTAFDSGLFLTAVGGTRYFLTPKIAGIGSLEIRLAGDDYLNSSLGITVGVDFVL